MPETMVPQVIEQEKKEDQGLVIRVLYAIPNEGHTQVEAYADRILGSMHMGKIDALGRISKQFEALLNSHAPDQKDVIMNKFWLHYPMFHATFKEKRVEFYFVTLGRIITPYAREEAAKLALEHHMDYLFMVDDDMLCPEDMFERLYRHDKDIVAPLAFTRNFPHKPVLYSIFNGYDPVRNAPYFKNHVVMKYPKDKLVECDAVGFGSVLIKTPVLKKLPQPWFMSTCGTGEDVYFCIKAREYGFRVFMDTSTKLGHLSHPQIINEEFVENMRKNMGMDVDKKNGDYKKYRPELVLGE